MEEIHISKGDAWLGYLKIYNSSSTEYFNHLPNTSNDTYLSHDAPCNIVREDRVPQMFMIHRVLS